MKKLERFCVYIGMDENHSSRNLCGNEEISWCPKKGHMGPLVSPYTV